MKLGTNIQRALLKRFSGSEVKGHGHVYKCVSVIMVEAYVLMIRHRGSLIYLSISVTLTCDLDLKNLKMYLGTKNELSGSRLSKVRQIDR